MVRIKNEGKLNLYFAIHGNIYSILQYMATGKDTWSFPISKKNSITGAGTFVACSTA
jgi:hypothetical protein